jgi:hypothetical protein
VRLGFRGHPITIGNFGTAQIHAHRLRNLSAQTALMPDDAPEIRAVPVL